MGQIAYDGIDSVVVADTRMLRRIDIATGTVTTILGRANLYGISPGAAPAALHGIFGVAVLPPNDGRMVLTDTAESTVLLFRAGP
jgi:hypothetical protein